MPNAERKQWFISLLLIAALLIPSTAAARGEETLRFRPFEGGMPLAVEPIYPANHREGVKGYYSLDVTPNQTQTLEVRLRNLTSDPLPITIQAVHAYTSPEGDMLYVPELDTADATLIGDGVFVRDLIRVEPSLTLPPGEERIVPITVTAPTEGAGTALGGIRFTAKGQRQEQATDVGEAREDEARFVIETETAFNLAIQLNFPGAAAPNFALGESGYVAENARLYIEMRNDAQLIQEGIEGTYRVATAAGATLFEGAFGPFKMAPMTAIRYPIPWGHERLENGDYRLFVTARANGRTFEGGGAFRIGAEELERYRENNPTAPAVGATGGGVPGWVWAILGAAAAVGAMYWFGRRKSKAPG
ncbi:DUF916 domain-containing protein [Paenibacillus sp.]|uniref:DUF916 domain-containing protein n=1 Tax=Paenibacillus sp. TaxID=58172 RepID=UPI002D288C17|nr:DUF916 domain-containing protein [Paenibacillus sp.]HZG84790.1 DUF916 domain-containing protein [Paenibacillus sp.]